MTFDTSDREAIAALEAHWRVTQPLQADLIAAGLLGEDDFLAEAVAAFEAGGAPFEVLGELSALSLGNGRFVWAADDDFEMEASTFSPPERLISMLRRQRPERLCLSTAWPVERHFDYLVQANALSSLTHLSVRQMGLGDAAPPPSLRGLSGTWSSLSPWLSSGGLNNVDALSLWGESQSFRALEGVMPRHLSFGGTKLPAHEILARLPKTLLSRLEGLYLQTRDVGVSVKGLKKELSKAPVLRILDLGDIWPSPSLSKQIQEIPVASWKRHGSYEDIARRLTLFGW